MNNENDILRYIKTHILSSSKDVYEGLNDRISYATIKRRIATLLEKQYLLQEGNAKNSRYSVSPLYNLFYPVDLDEYYQQEIDQRKIQSEYNFSLIPDVLSKVSFFTENELGLLNSLQNKFTYNLSQLTPAEYQNEIERMGIDLSWESSQIEGNTYSLLETERLLKEKEAAPGKKKEETVILLNHKDALDFIVKDPDCFELLTVKGIEHIHSILIKDLGLDCPIRARRVGITGTNYRPIDNESQIREALEQACHLVNSRRNVFEKALLTLVLLSYIHAFSDGNDRVARIVSNAIFIANKYCPVSFRTVDSVDYKKAMLLFYEQNNISAFKEVFINQFKFAVETYF